MSLVRIGWLPNELTRNSMHSDSQTTGCRWVDSSCGVNATRGIQPVAGSGRNERSQRR